jgi:hypothetical protein
MLDIAKHLEFRTGSQVLHTLDELPSISETLFPNRKNTHTIFARYSQYQDEYIKFNRNLYPDEHYTIFESYPKEIQAQLQSQTLNSSNLLFSPNQDESYCIYIAALQYALLETELKSLKEKDLLTLGPLYAATTTQWFCHAFASYNKLSNAFVCSTGMPISRASALQKSVLLPKDMDDVVQNEYDIRSDLDFTVDGLFIISANRVSERTLGAVFYKRSETFPIHGDLQTGRVETDILATSRSRVIELYNQTAGKKKIHNVPTLKPLCYIYHRFGLTNGLEFDLQSAF